MATRRDQILEAANASDESLSLLPFGAIVIGVDGTILSYNDYEERLSHLERKRVLGKNFFREVAPCTGVREFEGRMRAFLLTKESGSETFEYHFPFAHGDVDVAVTFVRMPDAETVLIAVERVDA